METIKMIDCNGHVLDAPLAIKDRLLKKGWQLAITVKEEPLKPTPINEVRDYMASVEKEKCDKECGPDCCNEPEIIEVPEITKPKPVAEKPKKMQRKFTKK